MKHLGLGVLLLAAASSGYAQNKNLEGKYALKLYNTTSWQKEEDFVLATGGGIQTNRHKEFQLLHPSIALRLTDKAGNMHEVELARMELGSVKDVSFLMDPSGTTIPLGGGKLTETNIALRYEYILNFMKKKNSRWMPSVGIGMMPYFERNSFTPELSVVYPSRNTTLGVRGWVTPRITYAISSRLL